jgi:hypothetical protein
MELVMSRFIEWKSNLEPKGGDDMPYEKFPVYDDMQQTLRIWQRKLEYLLNKNLNSDNIASTELTLGAAQVKASNIDFGTGANQVDAADILIVDNSSYFSSLNVETALQEFYSTYSTHRDSTTIHLQSTSITTLVPINSSSIVYSVSTAFATLSTTLAGTTELLNPVALNSDLIETNNTVNDIRQRLIDVGILTT